jgi:hypothetical protein
MYNRKDEYVKRMEDPLALIKTHDEQMTHVYSRRRATNNLAGVVSLLNSNLQGCS